MKIDYRQKSLRWVVSLIILVAFYLVSIAVLGAVSYALYSTGIISDNAFTFLLEAESLISLSIAVFLHAKFYNRQRLQEILDYFGLSKNRLSANAVWIGLLLFIIILIAELAVSAFGSFSNTVINTNTSMLFTGAPLWFYFFVAVIEPMNEEIVFRGFLINKINSISNITISSFLKQGYDSIWIGVVASAIIFGLLHSNYDSTFAVEVIAATFFGLLAGYVYKRSNSLYPSMLTHILINSLAVLAILGTIG